MNNFSSNSFTNSSFSSDRLSPPLNAEQTRKEDLNSIGIDDLVIEPDINQLASIVAKNASVVCVVSGETGTGKEEFAKLVHQRREFLNGPSPLVSVNCAHMNGDLAQSLLFGHTKGAFSGADKSTIGLVGEANGGILFLDEIHTLSIETQQKLLRVLNDGCYSRLGETHTQKSSFQVIAATTKDLDVEVEKNNFLIDLRARLIGLDVKIKPLRERKDDTPKLVAHFLRKKNIQLDAAIMATLIDKCNEFYWQANIRQLFSTLNAWVALCDGEYTLDKFPVYKNMLPPTDDYELHKASFVEEIAANICDAIHLKAPLEKTMDAIERCILHNSLEINRNITEVYRGLKISRNSFYVKRRKYNIESGVA